MFTFQAWQSGSLVGDPAAVVRAFTRGYYALWPRDEGHPDICFEIVDLRPGAYSQTQVEALIQRLTNLLLGDLAQCREFSATSRLLFVGNVRTLATREKENDNSRSIKQDAEFYIRTLQNYGVAHYAGIGIDATDSENVDMAIRSALIGIWRHYREKAPQPSIFRVSDRLMTINTDFVGLVASARKLLEYRYLGSPDTSEFDAGRIDHFQLLREIGLIYQFGKGDRPKAYSPTKVLENLHDRVRRHVLHETRVIDARIEA